MLAAFYCYYYYFPYFIIFTLAGQVVVRWLKVDMVVSTMRRALDRLPLTATTSTTTTSYLGYALRL